jgi:hypothetical protein
MYILHCINEVTVSGQTVTVIDKSYGEWIADEPIKNEGVTHKVFFGENIRRVIKAFFNR